MCSPISRKCAMRKFGASGSPTPSRAGCAAPAFKDLLKVPLYDYQREGALFAAKAGRCLIGDEMGLGKTIQALAAAEIMAKHFGVERVLIVCPTSLKHQWKREIEKFTDRSAEVINGLRTAPRRRLRRAEQLLQDHQLRHRPRRSRPDCPLEARSRHSRRSAAHQELEHARRPQRQEDQFGLCHRADGHAAGKSARGTHFHRAIRRSLPPRTDFPSSCTITKSTTTSAKSSAIRTSTASARRSNRS